MQSNEEAVKNTQPGGEIALAYLRPLCYHKPRNDREEWLDVGYSLKMGQSIISHPSIQMSFLLYLFLRIVESGGLFYFCKKRVRSVRLRADV